MSDRKSNLNRRRKLRNPPGRRYSPKDKARILKLAARLGVEKAAERSGASTWSIYRWRHDPRLASPKNDSPPEVATTTRPIRVRVPESVQKKVLSVWRNNPGFGPSQIHYQLRRVGVRCDTKTVRKILRAHGYTPPEAKPPRPRSDRRFEASRPLELVQMDVLHFYVHAQRLYLFLALDDHSRFITGWGLLQRESMDAAIDVLDGSIRRYGKPEAVLTDRGATFHTWRGIGAFDRFLESYDIEHRLADAEHPQTCGKVESVNRSIQKELIHRVEFRNFLDAKEKIASWIDDYNHQRTHQGIGGVLVPADRFFGRSDRVLRRIEEKTSGKGRGGPIPPELLTDDADRAISLFHIRLRDGMIELWLFGRLVAELPGAEEGET
jgi:putative transposase